MARRNITLHESIQNYNSKLQTRHEEFMNHIYDYEQYMLNLRGKYQDRKIDKKNLESYIAKATDQSKIISGLYNTLQRILKSHIKMLDPDKTPKRPKKRYNKQKQREEQKQQQNYYNSLEEFLEDQSEDQYRYQNRQGVTSTLWFPPTNSSNNRKSKPSGISQPNNKESKSTGTSQPNSGKSKSTSTSQPNSGKSKSTGTSQPNSGKSKSTSTSQPNNKESKPTPRSQPNKANSKTTAKKAASSSMSQYTESQHKHKLLARAPVYIPPTYILTEQGKSTKIKKINKLSN
jgi:hypothetical protein